MQLICAFYLVLHTCTFSIEVAHLKTEPSHKKTNNLGPSQVRHKPACTVTEAGQKLEFLDLRRRVIVPSL